MRKNMTRGRKTCDNPNERRITVGHQLPAGHSVEDRNDDKNRQIPKNT